VQGPWWAWLGGLCGAASLLSQPIAAPRLGAGTNIGLLITASSVMSVGFDHLGWPASPDRKQRGAVPTQPLPACCFFLTDLCARVRPPPSRRLPRFDAPAFRASRGCCRRGGA
jgi:hypothetical protein